VDELSLEDLAGLSGVDAAFVHRLADLDVLESSDGTYRLHDIARVRAADAWARSGIDPDMLHDLIVRGRYTMGWIDATYPDPVPLTDVTARQACAELGIDPDVMQRLFTLALQLPAPALDERMREDDLALLRGFALSTQLSPLSPDEVIANTRFFGDNLHRLSVSQVEAFRQVVMAPLLADTDSVFDAIDSAVPIARGMLDLAEQTVRLLHRRHVEQQGIEIVVENMELLLDDEGVLARRAGPDPAIAFLDLSDSTQLTDRAGDRAALAIADGLTELAARARVDGGTAVKFLGDGMMLHFADPTVVIGASLDLIDAAPDLGLPPARIGVSTGPVLSRDGDYFGRTVIVAARLNGLATANELLVTEPVAALATTEAVEALGPRTLKGIEQPVDVFRIRRPR
jgi:adenylate cyclase